ncbi:accessory gene regulator B family protein [Clostridium sp. FP2]|uniref:accessory gene regulator ArgB-like protein n=1 Tax=Clostridium sp. FP2 TaxID=2724481 RepID=UPI0013E9306F|nr:accessory gene regulator B family protein [Clostridium sp. FP2]MBZ9626338.1 accessory gene regulator B family protein [Clostridium sp. FP2]
MISILSNKMTLYIKENSNIKTDEDLEKINYALQAVIGETFKIAILISLFLILGKINYLLFSMMILFTLRSFVGGYHCDTTLKCLLYSTILFLITSLIGPLLPIFNVLFYYTISALSIFIVAIYAPFLNKKRPIKSKKRRWIIKLISIFVTIFWFSILLFYINSSTYLNCGFLTIILEVIQFLLTRKEYDYEN